MTLKYCMNGTTRKASTDPEINHPYIYSQQIFILPII